MPPRLGRIGDWSNDTDNDEESGGEDDKRESWFAGGERRRVSLTFSRYSVPPISYIAAYPYRTRIVNETGSLKTGVEIWSENFSDVRQSQWRTTGNRD